ncbi:hypothetical protein B6E78_08175 [Edwardsiella ictaluri]|nr:hypothetical protein B6E78_08175 [Edwardsiella ictaluri]
MFLGFIDLKPLTTAKKVILHFYLPLLDFEIFHSSILTLIKTPPPATPPPRSPISIDLNVIFHQLKSK